MAKTFAADITKFVNKTGISLNTVLRKLALDALKSCIFMSPVDTGRFRGNWRVAINHTDTSFDPNLFDKDGNKTLVKGMGVINKAQWGTSIVISNNVPYAGPLERGHSKQAPNGILYPSFNVVVAQFQAALKAV